MNNPIFFYNPYKIDTLFSLNFIPKTGLDCWIDLSFKNLREYYKNIEFKIVHEIPDEGVIVFHPNYFPKNLIPTKNQYFICAQADYGRQRYAQMHLVQNPFQLYSLSTNKRFWSDSLFRFCDNVYVPHWPHPKLISRNQMRGEIIKNVAYFGQINNFDQELAKELPGFLEVLGMNFTLKIINDDIFNYSEVDLALAVRSFPTKRYYNKPFWKLLNATLAGSLIIASDESSSLEFKRRHFTELPIVSSQDELKKMIYSMNKEPGKFFEPLNKANQKLSPIYYNGVVNQWRSVLNLASKKLEIWQKLSTLERKIFVKYRAL